MQRRSVWISIGAALVVVLGVVPTASAQRYQQHNIVSDGSGPGRYHGPATGEPLGTERERDESVVGV